MCISHCRHMLHRMLKRTSDDRLSPCSDLGLGFCSITQVTAVWLRVKNLSTRLFASRQILPLGSRSGEFSRLVQSYSWTNSEGGKENKETLVPLRAKAKRMIFQFVSPTAKIFQRHRICPVSQLGTVWAGMRLWFF